MDLILICVAKGNGRTRSYRRGIFPDLRNAATVYESRSLPFSPPPFESGSPKSEDSLRNEGGAIPSFPSVLKGGEVEICIAPPDDGGSQPQKDSQGMSTEWCRRWGPTNPLRLFFSLIAPG